MPRQPSALLRECLERANPQLTRIVEVSVPDAARVLRVPETLLATPDPLVSVTPTGGIESAPDGGVRLTSTSAALGGVPTASATSNTTIRVENASVRRKGCYWVPATTFPRATLRSVTVGLRFDTGFALPVFISRIQLQIYRVARIPGVLQKVSKGVTVETAATDFSFTPLLSPAPTISPANVGWANIGGSTYGADPTFDLSGYRLEVDNTAQPITGAPGEDNAYLFEVTPIDDTSGSFYQWRTAPSAPVTVSGVGTFQRRWWSKDDAGAAWVEQPFTDAYCVTLNVDNYAAAATTVHKIDLGTAPTTGTTARVVFERRVPVGTACITEVSTAGTGGPWAAVTHGDAVALQQVYHLRTTLTPDAAHRASPMLRALGVEAAQTVDVTAEARLSLPAREVGVPWGAGSIGRGQLAVLRLGARDFLDIATRLGSRAPATRLQVDTYLAPKHALATRDDYLRLDRSSVVERTPTPTAELYDLVSYAQKLKRSVPRKVESLNLPFTVVTAGTDYVQLTALPPSVIGTPGFSMRVVTSSTALVPAGTVMPIAGTRRAPGSGAGIDNALDFTGRPLAAALSPGDRIEIHSGVLSAGHLAYSDADVPDVWADVLDKALVLPERIGHGAFPRGGRPPSAAERAPASMGYTDDDRAKLLVTNLFTDGTEAAKILDALSALTGGCTLEVDGQIVWVQLYPVRGPDGRVTIPLPPVSRTIDARDYANLATPPTLAGRTVVASAAYGVNKAAANPDATPSRTVSWLDADALAFLDAPEFEFVGAQTLPDDIAAWCYSTADGGYTLAQLLARQMVLAGSTGLRVFSWTEPGAASGGPLALPGDVVSILTDQYTDVDPSSAAPAADGTAAPLAGGVTSTMPVRPIAGWTRITGVLVSVSGDGTTFRALIPGLAEGVALIGGGPGTQEGSTAPIPAPTLTLAPQVIATAAGGSVALAATYTPSTSPFFDHVEYLVERRAAGTTTYSAGTIVAGGRTGNDLIPADWQHDYRVTPVTVSTGGTRTSGTPATLSVGDPPAPAITFGTLVRESGRVRWPFTLSAAFVFAEVWVATSTADPGSAHSVEGTGTRLADITRGDGTTELAVTLPGANDYALVTAVPYGALLTRGTPVNVKGQGNSGAGAPAAPSAASVTSTTATTITLSVTPAVAGLLRIYRDGVAVLDVAAGSVGTPQTVVLSAGLTPSTAYAITASSVNGSSVESATRTSAGTATTAAGGTLVPPTLSASPYDTGLGGYYVGITNTGSYPSGVVYDFYVDGVLAAFGDTTGTLYHDSPRTGTVHTESVTAVARATGYTTSSTSSAVVVTIPK